jgi:CubicO group peptidase (beta-lactamase class C family)
MRFRTAVFSLWMLTAALGGHLVLSGAQAPPDTKGNYKAPAARFADPERSRKLAAAYPEVDRVVREFMERTHVPGAAWGIVVDGELAHAGAAGTRQAGSDAPVDADTVFRIASMTKSFTAMAILALRDEGKLSLDDPVERHVPELRGLDYPTTDSPRMTVRHLLSHSEGFPEDNPWGDQQLATSEEQFTEMLRRGIPFSNAPGVAYEYSNFGFAILGRVITNVAGVPYRRYVSTHVLKPLGMTSTTLDVRSVAGNRLAHGYRWEDETWKEEPPLPDGAFGCMGGMLSTVRDLARYVGAYLDAWPARDGAEKGPVRRASLREMQQVWRPQPAMAARDGSGAVRLAAGGYGFGLRISQTCDFNHVVAHSGGLPGFGSIMRWFPEYGVGFVALGSRTYTSWGGVADEVFALLARTGALRPREVQPSPALLDAKSSVSSLFLKWDDALADEIAAMNLFLDRSRDRRRAEFVRLNGELGACRADDSFEFVENALRGEWLFRCDKGEARASITLAPTLPPTVQYMEIRRVPPGERPRRAACPQ